MLLHVVSCCGLLWCAVPRHKPSYARPPSHVLLRAVAASSAVACCGELWCAVVCCVLCSGPARQSSICIGMSGNVSCLNGLYFSSY